MKKTASVLIALTVLLTVFAPFGAYADPAPETAEQSVTAPAEVPAAPTEQGGKWVKKKHKFYYFVNGTRLKGKQKIDGKIYYFDRRGVQRTGWRKIKKSYYYFCIGNAEAGYMERKKTVNGVRLRKNGKAVVENKTHLDTLVEASKVVDRATEPDMKKSKKLRKCFDYTIANYKYRGSPTFHYSKNWAAVYAHRMMAEGHGSCYEYGAWFAYVANACGIKECYAVTSGGHGWSEINGKICDLSWEQVDKAHDYYMMDKDLSGRGGRPNFKKHERYKVRI